MSIFIDGTVHWERADIADQTTLWCRRNEMQKFLGSYVPLYVNNPAGNSMLHSAAKPTWEWSGAKIYVT